MSDTPEKIILNTSNEAAKLTTVIGWMDRHGLYFGADEKSARYSGATHLACEQCGTATHKHHRYCTFCRPERMAATWSALEKRPWDGTTPVMVHQGDEFFMSAEEFIGWCADNEVEPEGVHLVHCKPRLLSTIDEDHFADDLPEDGELPPAIAEALAALNTAIQAHTEPVSWWADNVAVDPESLKGLEVPQ